MKFVRRVSLFLVMSVFMLGAGGYTALKAEQFFYPNRHQEKAVDRERDERVYDNMWASGENAKKEQVIEAAVEKIPVVTADPGETGSRAGKIYRAGPGKPDQRTGIL